MKKGLLAVFTMVLAVCSMTAQINTPAASPSAKLEQKVGLTDVTIEYSRPSMKGREIFSNEGLVRYGEMWRTGANAATKVTFSDDVMIKGQKLAAGSYAMLTQPNADEWNVHFHTYDGWRWSDYKSKTPALAIKVPNQKKNDTVETFLITVGNFEGNNADILLAWENTMIAIPMTVEVDSKVEADIKKTFDGPGRGDYYSAARYYYDSNKDMNQALEWIQRANEIDAKYWQLRLESQILAGLGKHIDAIAAAERSITMAKEADNMDYVRRNEESIKEWKDVLAKKSKSKKSK